MDGDGARILRTKIAERQWREAPAVADGRQPPLDPDAGQLELVADGERVYLMPGRRGGEPYRVRKSLVDGFWRTSLVDDAERLDEAAA